MRHQSYFWRSYMKGFMKATHEADPCLIEPLHRDISGRTCRRKHTIMWRSVTNAKDLPQKIHQPGGVLNPLSSPWPFAQWGLDIVGPFPKAAGNKKYLLVSTDYFTKWVEAEPLANTRDVDAKKFVWKNIVTRFGIPHTLISDNGLQFDNKAFRRYCCDLGITNIYSTLAYLQGNG